MKKILLYFAILFAFLMPAFSQVRDYVGIVRRVFTPEHMEYIESSKTKLSKKNQELLDKREDIQADYDRAMNPQKAEYAENVDKNSFGTGFVVVLDDGTNLVITNHHVVQGCKNAIIEFINPDTGESTIYENLTVHTLGDKVDIAILTFPNGEKPFKKGLSIIDTEVNDGDEVWSAGYPGLGSKPAWQFARGNVTSSKARINELMDSTISTIIQHSAPIDAGNSGGPLVVKNAAYESGYAVIGVNTWKASGRELTGFTIPAKMIKKLINKTLKDTASEEDAKKRVAGFFEVFDKRYNSFENVTDYISIHYADSITYEYVKNVIKSGIISSYYYFSEPLNAKYNTLSTQIWNKYTLTTDKNFDKTTDKYNFVSMEKAGDALVFVYEDTKKENTIVTKWIYETGLYQLDEISFTKESKKYNKEIKDQKLNKNAEYDLLKPIEITTANLCYTMPVFGKLDGAEVSEDYFRSGFSFEFVDTSLLNGWATMAFGIDWQLSDDEYLKLFGYSLGLQCPVNCNWFYVIPSVDVGAVVSLFSDAAVYGWYWEGKVSFYVEDWNFGAGASFKSKHLYPMREGDPKYLIPTVGIYVMFGS